VYVIIEERGVYNYVVVYVCVNEYGRGWGVGGGEGGEFVWGSL